MTIIRRAVAASRYFSHCIPKKIRQNPLNGRLSDYKEKIWLLPKSMFRKIRGVSKKKFDYGQKIGLSAKIRFFLLLDRPLIFRKFFIYRPLFSNARKFDRKPNSEPRWSGGSAGLGLIITRTMAYALVLGAYGTLLTPKKWFLFLDRMDDSGLAKSSGRLLLTMLNL